MKKIALLFILVPLIGITCFAGGVIVLEGKYQNRNLYVQNGYAESGVGYCTYEVMINGNVTTDEINSCSFEIDLTPYKFKTGSEVVVQIKYKDGCSPQVLNPEAIKPKATFETVSINVDQNGLLKWKTKNESGALPFIIEQFRWNKWVFVGEVQGLGTPDENNYSFQTSSHSGENRFRVKQVGCGILPRTSSVAIFKSTQPELTFTTSKNHNEILFSGETIYEIYDMYGKIVKKGYGNSVSAANLSKGIYYLCYDNSTTEFKRK